MFFSLALVYCFVSFHRVTMAVIGDLLADEFNLQPAQLGLLGGVLLYCYAFLQLPSGVFADRVGPKRTIILSLFLSAAGSVVFAMAPGFVVAMIGRILIGAGISFIYLSLIKILSNWFEKEEFGTVLGMLMSLGMLGNMFATAPLAISVKYVGWRVSYVAVGGIAVGLMALVHFRVSNSPDNKAQDSGDKKPVREETFVENLRAVVLTVWALMRNRSYLMLVIFMIAGSSQQGFQSLWAGPFLSRAYDYSLVAVGNALLWYSLGGVCGAPFWGFLSDRLFKSRKLILILSSVVAIVAWFFPAFMPLRVPPEIIPTMLFIMGVTWGGGVLTHAMVRESFSYEILGIAVGIINFFTFLGGAAFTQLMGHMVEFFPRTDGDYPLMAYQTTIMLIFVMWGVRIVSVALADERKA
ncbi:MAG: MFS transporter [Candidatus Abyssubacteria bacterium]